MGSRLKQDPDKIFDVFIEFVREIGSGDDQGRVVKFYPKDFNDAEVLKPSVKFAFPYAHGSSKSTEEHYAFVMTDINSKFKFGFCRLVRDTSVERNYCIISCLPWFDQFFDLLDRVSLRLSRQDQEGALDLLSKLHDSKPPVGVSHVICLTSSSTSSERVNFLCPNTTSLPSIPHDKNFSELFRSFRTANLMILFASMLFERRILMYGSSIQRLTSCIHGLNQLIYPMYWQHLFIPILPPSLIDYCSAPMPYVIGLHTSTMMKLHRMEYSDAVLVNLDEDEIHTEHEDLAAIPGEVSVLLKKQLKLQKALMEKSSAIGEGASRAFLMAMVSLIGGYRNAMRFHDGADITFDPDIFVAGSGFSRVPSSQHLYRPFFEMVLHMQSFQQFINDRLDIMNAGKGFQDEFDRAVISMSGDEDRWKTQSRYKDWLSHMKKQGKLLKREGKDKWTVFASKVKSKSKKTWKDMKSKLDDTKKEDTFHQHTKPSGHSISDYKPPRPPAPPGVGKDLRAMAMIRSGMLRRSSFERTQRYHLLNVDLLDSRASLSTDGEEGSGGGGNCSDDALSHQLKLAVDTDLSNDPDLMSWMVRSSRYEALSDASHMKKSFSVEGLCNGREGEGAAPLALLCQVGVCSPGKDSLVGGGGARSYSTADVVMVRNRLENSEDASSMDSSFAEASLRDRSVGSDRRNDLFSGSKYMSTSMSCSFRDPATTTTTNESHVQRHGKSGLYESSWEDFAGWSREDLMDFESSNSSIEFDPLKIRKPSATDDQTMPVPLPRSKNKRASNESSVHHTPTNGQPEDGGARDRPLVIPAPVPLPRRRDTASMHQPGNQSHLHHRKQTLNLVVGLPSDEEVEEERRRATKSPSPMMMMMKLDGKNVVAPQGGGPLRRFVVVGGSDDVGASSLSASTKLARSLFLQDVPASNGCLESFDPLASGQLIIDDPSSSSSARSASRQKSDDQLLKDWDLFDITKGVNSISFDASSSNNNKTPSDQIADLFATPPIAKSSVLLPNLVPLAVAAGPQFISPFNSSTPPSLVSKANKSSTLPTWATFQGGGCPGGPGTSSRSESLWETFE